MMQNEYTSWPEQQQQNYCQAGYWQPYSLGQCLRHWAQVYENRIALVDGKQCLSYRVLDDKVDQLTAGLHQLGISRGERVLMQLPNSNAFVIMLFALFRLGALPILGMPTQRENDINALCKLAEVSVYVIPERFLGFDYPALAEKIQRDNSSLKHVIVDGNTECFTPLADLYQQFPEISIGLIEPVFTDLALLLLSGGTTGTPKLIPRTHADYAYNARASAQLCELDQDSIYLAALPIAHNFPLACPGILGVLGVGGRVVMAKTPGADETFPLIEQQKVTFTALVPPLVKLWLQACEWDTTDISSLRLLQVGGARFETDLAQQVTPLLGCRLQQVFGMAEGLLCYTRLNDPEEVILNTQGRPLSVADEIRIVDVNGQEVVSGETGELWTRGPYTLRGYYRAQVHNAQIFSAEGFYRSGDLVRQRADGNLVVIGRVKEQINRAGEKIAVAEIEQLLNTHPAIDSSVLAPVPDERLGERSGAFVMLTDEVSENQLNLGDLHRYLIEQGVARYKLPDQLEIISTWPLTAVGKIDKKQLVALALANDNSTQNKKVLASSNYFETRLKISSVPIDLVLKLVNSGVAKDYAVYEHKGEWSMGFERYITLNADAHQVQLNFSDGQQKYFQRQRLCDAIAEAMTQIPVQNWRAYALAKFELSYVFYAIETQVDTADEQLLSLFVPCFEVRLREGEALLRALDKAQLEALYKLLQQLDQLVAYQQCEDCAILLNNDIMYHRQTEYMDKVQHAVDEIKDNLYQKVILSRRIPLKSDIDLSESYRIGRVQNTPARSFLVSYCGLQLAGFSPETVVEVSTDGWVSTQPLAGTRALGTNPQEEQQLREELLKDTKEIAEHTLSVKLAQEELFNVCRTDSVNISEFMTIRRRGSVQHLASRVSGQLAEGKNAWDAFEALFPAVTVSGIPKKPAIEAIARHEDQPRGWYSGCVMIIDSDGAMDAALVLRSIYRQGSECWLQVGAGIIDQSRPERELQETVEKLSCISQHLSTTQNIKSKQTTEAIT